MADDVTRSEAIQGQRNGFGSQGGLNLRLYLSLLPLGPPPLPPEPPYHSCLNSKDGSKEENALNGLNGMESIPSMLLTPHREDEILQPKNLKIFTFKGLKTATRNFRPDSVLGEGDSGTVFKGWIDEKTFAPTRTGTGMIIAVKRLNQELRCQEPSELLKYNAKLADVGFATNVLEKVYEKYLDIMDGLYIGRAMDSSHYAAPEHKLTGLQTKKSYVYSFGVFYWSLCQEDVHWTYRA
ncbi:hypothetical protein Fmac_014622 [Flemingia macrophylla]|uniref:Protein kinase domain-containing protein n=1 Tax=Flemingia macrophylla TaxID=520843 RepID=A0ABD1MCB2_9FABA